MQLEDKVYHQQTVTSTFHLTSFRHGKFFTRPFSFNNTFGVYNQGLTIVSAALNKHYSLQNNYSYNQCYLMFPSRRERIEMKVQYGGKPTSEIYFYLLKVKMLLKIEILSP